MRQTLAILLDAYRELNARKLFWGVLLISAAMVAGIALFGNNERGMTFVGYTLEVPFLSTKAMSKAGFYKFVFSTVGVQFWLSWGATILALISTAGMIPEFVSSGSIELSLSKPIGRARLFLTKYFAGLLFATLQVLIFSIGGFLLVGIRGGQWVPSIFLAVPLVVVFFSYLYCVCALVGLVTRSAITALLATIVFWLGLWAINSTDGILLSLKTQGRHEVQRLEARVAATARTIADLEAQIREAGGDPAAIEATKEPAGAERSGNARHIRPGGPFAGFAALFGGSRRGPSTPSDSPPEQRLADAKRRLESLQQDLTDGRNTATDLAAWHGYIVTAKTYLPKTGETTKLLDRWIIDPADKEGLLKMIEQGKGMDTATKEMDEEFNSRTVGWIVGTSLGFEAVVVGFAVLIFCRRDY